MGIKTGKEPIVPDECKDCKYLCITQATGLVNWFGAPIGTCSLNYPPPDNCSEWRGVYQVCKYVLSDDKYKCVKR